MIIMILTIPPELCKARQANDRAVMEAYGFWGRLNAESECVAALMKLYQQFTTKQKENVCYRLARHSLFCLKQLCRTPQSCLLFRLKSGSARPEAWLPALPMNEKLFQSPSWTQAATGCAR